MKKRPIHLIITFTFILFTFFVSYIFGSDISSGSKVVQNDGSWDIKKTFNTKRINSASVSPDNKYVITSISTANITKNNWDNEVYLINIKNKKTIKLNVEQDESLVSYTPDPDYFSFVKITDKANTLYVKGITQEAAREVYTTSYGDIVNYKWSPDFKQVALIIMPKPGTSKKPYDAYNKKLIIVNLDNNKSFTIAKINDLKKFDIDTVIDWHPTKPLLAFAFTKDHAHYQLATINTNTHDINTYTQEVGIYKNPFFSHDGTFIAYTSNTNLVKPEEPDISYASDYASSSYICLLSMTNNTSHCLNSTPDNGPTIIGWQDNSAIYFYEFYHTTIAVYKYDLKHNKIIRQKVDETIFPLIITKTSENLVFVASSYTKAPEIYYSALNPFKPKQISQFQTNTNSVSSKTISISWKGYGQQEVEGLLTLPATFNPDKPPPLLIALHGGPTGIWVNDYVGIPLYYAGPICMTCLAENGIAVFRPNVHGSIGYGKKFRLSNYKKLGIADYADIITGLDYLIANKYADKNKLAIWGWSYGGYLTAVTLTKTDRFKVGIVGAGPVDLRTIESQSTTSYPMGFYSAYLGSHFWENFSLWSELSPVNYVTNINTPTLVQIGEEDKVVPISQAYELYYPLKMLNKDTDMIVYSGQDHNFSSPKQLYDATQDMQNWVFKYIMKKP